MGRSTLDGLFDIMTGMNTGAYVCDSCGKGYREGIWYLMQRIELRELESQIFMLLRCWKVVKR